DRTIPRGLGSLRGSLFGRKRIDAAPQKIFRAPMGRPEACVAFADLGRTGDWRRDFARKYPAGCDPARGADCARSRASADSAFQAFFSDIENPGAYARSQ